MDAKKQQRDDLHRKLCEAAARGDFDDVRYLWDEIDEIDRRPPNTTPDPPQRIRGRVVREETVVAAPIPEEDSFSDALGEAYIDGKISCARDVLAAIDAGTSLSELSERLRCGIQQMEDPLGGLFVIGGDELVDDKRDKGKR